MTGTCQRLWILSLSKQRKLSQTACWTWSIRWASFDLAKGLLGQPLPSMLPRAASNWARNYLAFHEFPISGLKKCMMYHSNKDLLQPTRLSCWSQHSRLLQPEILLSFYYCFFHWINLKGCLVKDFIISWEFSSKYTLKLRDGNVFVPYCLFLVKILKNSSTKMIFRTLLGYSCTEPKHLWLEIIYHWKSRASRNDKVRENNRVCCQQNNIS